MLPAGAGAAEKVGDDPGGRTDSAGGSGETGDDGQWMELTGTRAGRGLSHF